jgi:hypothetical protein
MVIFISSVRRGLEQERDALPGLFLALGHEPRRFEDYTAQPVPPREACLRGVEEADVYLLLVGPHYGDPVFDTGLSPTEEEFVLARRRGIPVLVFRKRGVDPEPRQADFIKRVEEYTGGQFRDAFDGPNDLQPKVVAAVRRLEEPAKPLTWAPLDQPVEAPWLYTVEQARTYARHVAALECHVVPVGFRGRIPATTLEALPHRLAELGRQYELFGTDEALDLGTDPDAARAAAAGRHAEPTTGIRVRRDGVVSVWSELQGDGLGYILDPTDVRGRLIRSLRLAGDLLPADVDRVSLAVGLAPISSMVEGSLADLGRRTSASIGMPSQDWARVEPEDSIPASVIGTAAEEIAAELTARLLQRFRVIRR